MTEPLQKLHNACVEMEAFMWAYAMRPSPLAPKSKGVFQDSTGTQSFRELLDAERAKQMSAASRNGLGEMLYRELSRRVNE